MKLSSKIYQKYADVIRPPALEGEDEIIPKPSKVPEIAPVDLEQMAKTQFIYDRDQPFLEEYLKLKRKRELKQAYPHLSNDKIEELFNREKKEISMTPEEIGHSSTFLNASYIDDLSFKYAANSVTLLPPPEEALNEEIIDEYPDLPPEDELAQFSLKPPPLPNIKTPNEKDMKHWEHWINFTNRQKDYYGGESSTKDDSTIPPPRKVSAEVILKCCNAFDVLSRK